MRAETMNHKKRISFVLFFGLFLSLFASCTSFTNQRTYREMKDESEVPDTAQRYQNIRQTEEQTKSITSKKNEANSSFSTQAQKLEAMKKRWSETLHLALPASPLFDFTTEKSRKIRVIAETDAIQSALEKGMDLESLLAIAIVRNPKLKAAKKQWEASLERYTQATGLDNILRQYQSFVDDLNLRSSQMRHKAPIMKRFPFPGTLALKGDIIDKEVALAKERFNIVLRDLITDIRVTYAALQYNIEQTKITGENLEILRQLEETAFVKYETSKANFSDVIKVQVRIAQLADDLLTLKDFRETLIAKLVQWLNFKHTWQLGPPRPVPLRDTSLSIQAIISSGRKHQQEIRIASLKIVKTNLAILLAEKRFYPDLTLGYSTLEAEKSGLPARLKKVETPFWFGKNDAYVREARLKYQALLQKRQVVEDKLVYTITNLVFQLSTAKRDVDLYQTSLLPLAQEAFEVAETEYLAGKVSFLDLLDAESTWLKYKLLYHKSIRNQNQSIARLEQTIGRRLP